MIVANSQATQGGNSGDGEEISAFPTACRRMPIGAELREKGVDFRVWAPQRRHVSVVLEGAKGTGFPLTAEGNGYFSSVLSDVRREANYWFRLDEEARLYPDPASRFQPEGPHGPSQVVDPDTFRWTDQEWRGVGAQNQVVYELHVGTFTPEGTWKAAAEKLPWIAELGLTLIEALPVADFSGEFGWGYDGVNLFAPTRLYGTPDEFRQFVDQAHALKLGVILDVVYNHFGPDGNYHHAYSRDYFTERYKTDWGKAINFDGPHSASVREFVKSNAAYWIREFHLDGLRFDATQDIHDSSEQHILGEIANSAREAAGSRTLFLVAENEHQDVRTLNPAELGGFGIDAVWNDDLHHTAIVALTGHCEAYYSDYRGTPQEFLSATKWGFLYQGQWYRWQQKRRGTPALKMKPWRFVSFLQNHDQIANFGKGLRVHQVAAPGRYRALTALLLLSPATPMFFQGQEFGAGTPFFYFADHRPDLARLVDEGRKNFLSQFPSLASAPMQASVRDPAERSTFLMSKLDWSETERNREAVALHRDLLNLRKSDPAFSRSAPEFDGAVLSGEAFLLRYFDEEAGDRLLLVNLGCDLELDPCPEPFLAVPAGSEWRTLWSSEDPRYGGLGTPPLEKEGHPFLPGNSTVVFAARKSASP
jgi:maltooligosyltrehalose trehalohydrolase